jgi:hypothetical protein
MPTPCSYHRVDAKVAVFREGKPSLLFSVQNITFSVEQGLRINGKLFTCWFLCLKLSALFPSFCLLLAESFRRGKKQEHLSQLGNVCFSGSFAIIILQGDSDKSGILQ